MPARGKENDGRSSATVSVPTQPLQPHTFATPQPVAKPPGQRQMQHAPAFHIVSECRAFCTMADKDPSRLMFL